MPFAPKRPCTHPGCPQLTDHGQCEQHRRQTQREVDRRRPTATQRGYDGKWKIARDAFLKRNPYCAECQRQGKITKANVVDHIKAHKGNMQLFWDVKNWEALCGFHNRSKAAKQEGRWGDVKDRNISPS